MGKQDQDSIQAFDALYTTNQIQIMKILLPFCPPETRRSLAVIIRFLEFQYTLTLVRSHPECFRDPPLPFSLGDICEKISGYCPPQLRSLLEQVQSMQNAMQMYEEMKQVMDLFGEENFMEKEQEKKSQDGASDRNEETDFQGQEAEGFMDPLNMLMGMLSPSQKEMFQMFQSGFQKSEFQKSQVLAEAAEKKPPEKEN